MSDIYSNAYLTVAASSARSDTDGFLERPAVYAGCLLKSDEKSEKLDVMAQKLVYHGSSPTFGRRPDILEGPLASRGWAIQENVLSRRVISYCVGEILFECNCKITCECGYIDHQVHLQQERRVEMDSHIGPVYRKPFQKTDDTKCLYLDWRRAIIEFTHRELTKPSDRLPALSGIVSELAGLTGDTYLAGLWKTDLQAGLLWYREHADLVTPAKLDLPSGFRAPTFSWASIEGSVAYNSFLLDDSQRSDSVSISVQHAQCTAPGANPFGQVSDGFVMLSGLVHQTTLEGHLDGYNFGWSERFRGVNFYPDAVLSEAEITTSSGSTARTIVRVGFHDGQAIRKTEVTCLMVAMNPHEFPLRPDPQNSNFTHFNVFFLLVLGRSSSVPDAHERLGLLKLGVQDGLAPGWLARAKMEQLTII